MSQPGATMPPMPPNAAIEALQRACWNCRHYRDLTPSGNSARCMFRGQLHIHVPLGSCYFERVPGSDDCLTSPTEFDRVSLSHAWREMVAGAIADEDTGPG